MRGEASKLGKNTLDRWRITPPGENSKFASLKKFAVWVASRTGVDARAIEWRLRWLAAGARIHGALDRDLGADSHGEPWTAKLDASFAAFVALLDELADRSDDRWDIDLARHTFVGRRRCSSRGGRRSRRGSSNSYDWMTARMGVALRSRGITIPAHGEPGIVLPGADRAGPRMSLARPAPRSRFLRTRDK